jgi:hypothetical protein
MIEMIDLSLMYLVIGILLIGLCIALIFSDMSKRYKIATIIIIIITVIMEVPHFYIDYSFSLLDYSVHIFGGMSLAIIVMNLRFIRKERRKLVSIALVIISIILIETGLSVIEILTSGLFVNPIGINSITDILTTIFGGFIIVLIS